MLLGAVLAGGLSRRFGSDKAVATLGEERLIDLVIAGLQLRTNSIVICGRTLAGYTSVTDRPRLGLGPLGGLAAALNHARRHGFEAVLTAPCDTPHLPDDVVLELLAAQRPAYLASSPVIGIWPATLSEHLDHYLSVSENLSMRHWANLVNARALELGDIPNINTVEDLRRISDG